jgi:hypothetical protein
MTRRPPSDSSRLKARGRSARAGIASALARARSPEARCARISFHPKRGKGSRPRRPAASSVILRNKKTFPLLTLAAVLAFSIPGSGRAQEESPSLPAAPPPPASALELRLEQQSAEHGKWLIEPHRPSYLLPVSYIPNPSEQLEEDAQAAGATNEFQNVEIKFQFSLQLALAKDLAGNNGDLYFAYTQVSVWQAYNFDASSPFRDTNYEPELYLACDTDCELFGLRGRLLTIGAVHQSNGRSDFLSPELEPGLCQRGPGSRKLRLLGQALVARAGIRGRRQ